MTRDHRLWLDSVLARHQDSLVEEIAEDWICQGGLCPFHSTIRIMVRVCVYHAREPVGVQARSRYGRFLPSMPGDAFPEATLLLRGYEQVESWV